MDPMFPPLPDDLNSLSDEDLVALEAEHVAALQMVREDNREFTGDLNAVQIVEQTTVGRAQLQAIRDHNATLASAIENYQSIISELTSDVAETEEEPVDEDEAKAVVLAAEDVLVIEEIVVEDESASSAAALSFRRPPAPTKERQPLPEPEQKIGSALVAAGYSHEWVTPGTEFGPNEFAKVVIEKSRRLGRPNKNLNGTEEKYLLASASFEFPEDRKLTDNLSDNARKVHALQNTDGHSLVASGGLCAPLTPIYSIPNFATNARPVRDALPSFNADRGGVTVPVPTTLAAAADAITVITEAEDALGGTYATKSCLAQTCLEYVETAVTIISHCREYGNLNARAWPESIAYENAITMAEHSRTAEGYLLDRIKAQSINLTTANVYSTTNDLIYAITRAASAIRYILRADDNLAIRAMIPRWVPDNMVSDVSATPFDRFINRQRATEILRMAGVEPSFYIDTPSTGTTQGFADATAGALQDFPDVAQYALYVEGAFIHVDGGTLNLGLVRDSTLNSTNDFQEFGETFENVARLAPEQAAYWLTSEVCPSGSFPALATALAC